MPKLPEAPCEIRASLPHFMLRRNRNRQSVSRLLVVGRQRSHDALTMEPRRAMMRSLQCKTVAGGDTETAGFLNATGDALRGLEDEGSVPAFMAFLIAMFNKDFFPVF